MADPAALPEPELTDALLPDQEMPIRLPVFEGPLDLLLFLIRRNEIDIYDIPIESVTKQYLDALNAMENLNLEIAGDFFVMAATLMYIKSRMLLPISEAPAQEDEEEEDADPRWELVQQLLEYKKFKEAASQLDDLIALQQDYLPRDYRHQANENEKRPLQNADRIEVWNTFNLVLRRLSEKIRHGEIQGEQVSLSDRMEFLLDHMQTHRKFSFSSLFEADAYTLNMLVATFLAVLELTRLKRMRVEQHENFADVYCTALSEQEAAIAMKEESMVDNETTASTTRQPPAAADEATLETIDTEPETDDEPGPDALREICFTPEMKRRNIEPLPPEWEPKPRTPVTTVEIPDAPSMVEEAMLAADLKSEPLPDSETGIETDEDSGSTLEPETDETEEAANQGKAGSDETEDGATKQADN